MKPYSMPKTTCTVERPSVKLTVKQSGSLLYKATLPGSGNNSHLKIIKLLLYSNVNILPAEAARGHQCSPLQHVSNLIPDLRGTVETDNEEKVGITN